MSDAPNLISTIAEALQKQGYDNLTPVQLAVTDPKLGDSDLLVSAQTGSGKTVGFGLAIAPTILADQPRFGPAAIPLALIIAPTRELALQVKRELIWLYGQTGAIVASCVGGMDMRDERRALDRGAHIVVATPGRLRDHVQRGSMDMSALRAVVLDEADEMLDLGFREDLEFILGEAPEDRRTLLFSATVPPAIATLAKNYQTDSVRITTNAEKSQHADIEYRALSVASGDPENAIINVLRYYEAQNALVFCNTRAMVNRLTSRFSNRGFSVVALSGELSQSERSHALQAMRDGRARVCIATDVAARGIDLPNLELVIHAELPSNAETLLHRSGRTGRAGRKGISALIVPSRTRGKAERLLRFAKLNAEWATPPSADDVLQRDQERLLADPVWEEPLAKDEKEFVEKLTALHSAEQIAAAYVRLYRSRQSAPEELAPVDKAAPKRARDSFGPSTWFSVSVGRKEGAEPRWLLPMLCRAGNISKDDIGAIRVQDTESLIELAASSVDGFLKSVGADMKLEDGAVLRKLDHAPDLSAMPRPTGRTDRPKPRNDKSARPARDGGHKKRDFGGRQDDRQDNPARKPRQKHKANPNRPGHKPKSDFNPDDGPPKDVVLPKPRAEKQAGPKPAPAKPKRGPNPKGNQGGQPKGGESTAKKPRSADAADPSKRFTPPGAKPNKKGKGKPRRDDKDTGRPSFGNKPKVSRGANAVPKRRKPRNS